jgi:hypothetical protein
MVYEPMLLTSIRGLVRNLEITPPFFSHCSHGTNAVRSMVGLGAVTATPRSSGDLDWEQLLICFVAPNPCIGIWLVHTNGSV